MKNTINNKKKGERAKIINGVFDSSTQHLDNLITSIYNKHNQRLRQYINYRMTSDKDVDDVSQEVYLRLSRHKTPHTLKPSFPLLRTIASNILKDLNRIRYSRKADTHIPIHNLKIVSSAPSPEDIVSSREGLATLTKIFESLNKNSRKVFLLHRLKGLNYMEIAEEMNISKAMVQKHISYVLLQLKKKLCYEEDKL